MKRPKQNWGEHRLNLVDHIGRADAWGTDLGARVFSKINTALTSLDDSVIVRIDYGGLERSDVSFQREAVVETLRKHRPKLLFVAEGLSDDDLRLNLEMALSRRGEAVLSRGSEGVDVLGKPLPPEHRLTLERVWQLGEVTSSALLEDAKRFAGSSRKGSVPNLSTMSSRLIALWKAGLLARVEGSSPSGGREHRYYAFE